MTSRLQGYIQGARLFEPAVTDEQIIEGYNWSYGTQIGVSDVATADSTNERTIEAVAAARSAR